LHTFFTIPVQIMANKMEHNIFKEFIVVADASHIL
jgi:hypothetical protein